MRWTMRVVAVIAALSSASCATKPNAVASCGPLTLSQQADLIFETVQRTFGERTEGYTVLVDSKTVDPQGRVILQLKNIEPSLPTPTGGGERLAMVVQTCPLKVVSTSRPTG